MLKPNFLEYSIALRKDGKIIFSSDKPGLRPLMNCIMEYKEKVKDCVLFDKIIGLAAAKIIVSSEMIKSVITNVVSKPAKNFLDEKDIEIKAKIIVENIFNKEKTDICPMESKAMKIKDENRFYDEMLDIFKVS